MGIIIRQSIKSTIVNYVGTFIGFLTTMFLLTKFLEAEEIGLMRVIYDAALLLCGFAQLGITSSAMRYFPYFKNKENNNNGFFFYLILVPTIGCLIFIPLYLLASTPICDYFEKNSSLFVDYYLWVIPLMFFLLYWSVFETYSNILMRIAVPRLVREVIARLLLVLVYLLYAYHVIQIDGLVGGFIAAYGLSMILTFLYVSRIGSMSLKHDFSFLTRPFKREIGKYTAFLVVGSLGGSIISKLDLFMVSGQMGLDYAGIYTVAFYMAAVIDVPSRSIIAISAPVAAMAMKEGDISTASKLFQKVSLHQLLAGSFIFIFIWINIDNIFKIIPNGELYQAGKWVVLLLGAAKLIEITLNFGSSLITFSKYYYWVLFFTFFITGTTILTNYLLIPVLGITGAALATLVTCLITYSVQQFIILKKIKASPYSWGIVKQYAIILLLLGLNLFLPEIDNPWIDGVYRTLAIGGFGIGCVYLMRISEEVNEIIRKVFRIVLFRKG